MTNIYIVADFRDEQSTDGYSDHYSRNAVKSMVKTVRFLGYNPVIFGGVKKLVEAIQRGDSYPDQLFLNLSDGGAEKHRKAQASLLLEMLNAKVSGSGALQLLVMADKNLSKKIASRIGVCVPSSILWKKGTTFPEIPPNHGVGPYIVKPNAEGSSIGIENDSFCQSMIEAKSVAQKRLDHFDEVLIESYIDGYEVTVFIIGNVDNFLLCEVILFSLNGEFYNRKSFFNKDIKMHHKIKRHRPAEIISEKVTCDLLVISKLLFVEFECRDVARIDYRITKDEKIYFLEINGLPVMSETSELGAIAGWYDCSYHQIASNYIEAFINRIQS